MDLCNIPSRFYPAYTWLWNTAITREGIRDQLREMHTAGIRGFYVIGEPENFRPGLRNTHLSPEYLSEEYLELLHYAWEVGNSLGMTMWLYNEGGFPSGMVCGQIRQAHPELTLLELRPAEISLPGNTPYVPTMDIAAAFSDAVRIFPGQTFRKDTVIREYRICPEDYSGIRTDISIRRNTELFLQLTHEKLFRRFGSAMGGGISIMFDDEASMGTWTRDFDRIFRERYGYDILDYLPWIALPWQNGQLPPRTPEQHRAASDYIMLCGELVRDNYFTPMKQWLRQHNMCSAGHLDNDHRADGTVTNRYGSALQTLREFDIPGIDVIWEQIAYPKDGKPCPEGIPFFPRMASSAARQLGHSTALSESLAVYGSHVDPELMRYVVGYQAVRGISLFNFMVVSYDRETPMSLQYRPNFNGCNPGMDRLSQINTYTARLSRLLQESKAEITTALYYPARTICAGGEVGKQALDSFTTLGNLLEEEGVSFDIIDEALVRSGTVRDHALHCEKVAYRYVFRPQAAMEPEDVTATLSQLEAILDPCLFSDSPELLARPLLLPDGNRGCFLFNQSGTLLEETVGITGTGIPYRLDLLDGTLYALPEYSSEDDILWFPLRLHRGEGLFLVLSDTPLSAQPCPGEEVLCTLENIRSFVSRRYSLSYEEGIRNERFPSGPLTEGLHQWDPAFSGEVTYLCPLPRLEPGRYILDLGEVRCTAAAYLDGQLIGEATMLPYRIPIDGSMGGRELRIVVANTAANVCARSDYFSRHPAADVGPYHENMQKAEAQQPGGGLLGPVRILRKL